MSSDGDSKAQSIQIVTCCLLASAVVCALARIYTKHVVVRYRSLDDCLVLLSLVFLIGQSACVIVATTNGLGSHSSNISTAQIALISKAQYAAMLLYIPGLVMSKLPSAILLKMILPVPPFRRFLLFTSILIGAWGVSAELVSAFRCHPPDTWDLQYGVCLPISAFVTYLEVMNAVTEALLMVLPFLVVFRAPSRFGRKFAVLGVFCARLLPMGAIIAKVVLYWLSVGEPDPLYAMWPVAMSTQLIQFLSFLASCMLYLRPFLDSLSSSRTGGDGGRRREQPRPYILQAGDLDEARTDSFAPDTNVTVTEERGRGRSRHRRDSQSTHQPMSEVLSDEGTTLWSEGPSRHGVTEQAPSTSARKDEPASTGSAGE